MVKHKRNDSESEGASPQPERVFRISVCLKQFFSDERALACVQVSGARPVRWLARRLRRAFPLPRGLQLLSRGHLLPPDEPLALLDRDDLVRVVPARLCSTHVADEPDSDHSVTTKTLLKESTARCPVRSPSPDRPASPSLNNLENLLESKQRAIQLLDQYCGDVGQDPTAPGSALQRARRRRVRRRRKPAFPLISDELEEHRDASSVTAVVEASGATSAGEEVSGEAAEAAEADAPRAEDEADGVAGAVLRNASPARAPRVVRPLSFPA